MITFATLPEFKACFGTNEKRRTLLASLDAFLDALQANFRSFRVLAYGSFITEKEEPGDIDVMVYVCSTPVDSGFNKVGRLQQLANKDMDVFSLKVCMSFDQPTEPHDAAAMVEGFNGLDAHVIKKIRCDRAIELVL